MKKGDPGPKEFAIAIGVSLIILVILIFNRPHETKQSSVLIGRLEEKGDMWRLNYMNQEFTVRVDKPNDVFRIREKPIRISFEEINEGDYLLFNYQDTLLDIFAADSIETIALFYGEIDPTESLTLAFDQKLDGYYVKDISSKDDGTGRTVLLGHENQDIDENYGETLGIFMNSYDGNNIVLDIKSGIKTFSLPAESRIYMLDLNNPSEPAKEVGEISGLDNYLKQGDVVRIIDAGLEIRRFSS